MRNTPTGSSGFNGALILTNKTKETIRDWTITFGANRPITQVDSSVLTDNSDGTYTITNDGNNQNIAKNQTYRIGIQGGANDPSKAFTLTDFTATAKKMALKLTDDKDKNGVADVLEVDFNGAITVTPTVTSTPTNTVTSTPTVTNTPSATATPTAKPTATSKPTATNTPTSTNKPTSTPTATSTPTTKPTISATPTAKPTVTSSPTATPKVTVTNTPTNTPAPTISSTPTPTATISTTPTVTITATPTPTAMPTGIPDDIDYEKDTDKDGLPDYLEDNFGTDKNKVDTDGDGVNDLHEILLETDPITPDSNGSYDFDNDGLTNAKESQIGTNPKNRDTDLDGLADGAEVNLYGTDPNKHDTDDDGMSDYFEVYTYDCNPIVKDSDKKREQTLEFYPKANNKLDGVVKVEISGAITGAMSENTKIRDIYGKDLHTSSIEALVGVPVDIETTGEFDEMTVRFYYEEGNFDEDDLMIMWYDEENGEYVEWEDTVWLNDGANYVEFKTNHFSKYMLIDEKVWIETWIKAFYSVEDDLLNHASYSAKSHLNDMLARYGDKDVDGLPDIMETNGMIDNIGHIVHTDPTNADSDKDLLSDGYEMGEISLTEKIFTRSYYFYNKMSSYVVSGDATYVDYVFFKCRSEADNDDSDGDGVIDEEDATPNEKNEPINYIFMGKDKPGEFEISIAKNPYKRAFNKIGENVVVLDIYKGTDFDTRLIKSGKNISPCGMAMYALEHLQCDLEIENLSELKKYSKVNKLIIISHGYSHNICFIPEAAGQNELYVEQIHGLNISINIDILDIQACHCGRPVQYEYEDFSAYTCVAFEFAQKKRVSKVYAWTDESKFFAGWNCSFQGGTYEVFYLLYNDVIHFTVETNNHLGSMPLYSPLQY